MSNTATNPIGTGRIASATAAPAPGFLTALRGEVTYVRANKAVWISLGVWAACVVLFAYLVSYLTTVGGQWYTPEQQAMYVNAMLPGGTGYYALASLPMYGAPQFAILGVILGAAGYASGTLRTVAARFSGRAPLMAARLVTLTVVALTAAIFTLLASMLSGLGVAAVSDNLVAFPPLSALVSALLIIWLVAGVFIAVGFAMGTLLRRTLVAAIVALVWILGVEALFVGMLAPVLAPLDAMQGFLPVGATTSLAAEFVPPGQQTVPAMTAATGPVTAVLVLVGWLLAAALVALWDFRRRDLA